MARKIDKDDYVWMGDHHFNGTVTGINGGGGGAVDSVNGQTGEVVLTAVDVNAATVDDINQAISDLSLGSAAQSSSTDFATAAQGELADSAVQPDDLPDFGTAAEADSSDFATASQGALADTAVQPGDIPATPTWTTISGKPTFVAEGANAAAARTSLGLGTAATTASTAYATSAQGALADTAVQPAAIANVVRSQQEGGVGILANNILMFENGDLPDVGDMLPNTIYIEKGV